MKDLFFVQLLYSNYLVGKAKNIKNMSFNLLRQVESLARLAVNSLCSPGCPLISNPLAFLTLQRWDYRCALLLALCSAGE